MTAPAAPIALSRFTAAFAARGMASVAIYGGPSSDTQTFSHHQPAVGQSTTLEGRTQQDGAFHGGRVIPRTRIVTGVDRTRTRCDDSRFA
jgi:hypothetical protein